VPSEVTVTLDGSEPMSIPLAVAPPPDGTTFAKAIPVVVEAGQNVGFAEGDLTTNHADLVPPGSTERRSDLIFRLPAAAADRLITVTQDGGADRLALTMWDWDGGTPSSPPWMGSATTTKTSFNPTFRFLQTNDHCYLAVEYPSRNLGHVRLRFEW
jgi:hypothetical protein